jgi:hypothetical protein
MVLSQKMTDFRAYRFSSHLSNGGYHFSAALQEHCDRRLEVVNRGLSGYNTENILKILPELIPSPFAAKVEYLVSHISTAYA